jgi:hypothetical protein
MNLLSTRTHGAIDYVWAGLLPVLPHLFGWSPPVTRLLTGASAGTLLYSLFTRYELGAVPLLSLPAHLALDMVQGTTLLTAPLWLDADEEASAALVGLGLIALTVALTTERSSVLDVAVRGRDQSPRTAAAQEWHQPAAATAPQAMPIGRLG